MEMEFMMEDEYEDEMVTRVKRKDLKGWYLFDKEKRIFLIIVCDL